MSDLLIKTTKYTGELLFDNYPFILSDFQKHSLEAVSNGFDTLVCAPTGSGKTLIAEASILKYYSEGKKIIYTSPIKALSNYIFKSLRTKFPHIDIGILTGDIKYNLDAQLIIMTTENLRNLLYNKKIKVPGLELTIEIDIYNDVGSIIFDEIHYIGDKQRGTVWEESIMLIPKHISLVMLSATIENPQNFGKWVTNIKQKPLVLSKTLKRAVPLIYSIFFTVKKKVDKLDNDPKLDKYNHKLTPILRSSGEFKDTIYHEIVSLKKKYNKFISKNNIFDELVNYLQQHDLLPTLVFCLSRKKCEQYAKSNSIVLNDTNDQVLASKQFEHHLRKSDNYKNIIKMNQYFIIKDLVSKGVAFHHSGVYPIFKEIIEILFEQKLIKLLFCTETFAVGINMPTKTTVFAGLTKFTNNESRYLLAHEFNQMAGRAGRRGMDKVGNVIILPSLYDLPTINEIKIIMSGKHQLIYSQFSPNIPFILKVLLTSNNDIETAIKYSLLNKEISEESEDIRTKLNLIDIPDLNLEQFKEYDRLENPVQSFIKPSQKDLKRQRKKLHQIKNSQDFKDNYDQYQQFKDQMGKKILLEKQLKNNDEYVRNSVLSVLEYLKYMDYIDKTIDIENYCNIKPDNITKKGIIASQINECNQILLVEIIYNDILDNLLPEEIVAILAMFLTTKVESNLEKSDLNKVIIHTKNKINNLHFKILKDFEKTGLKIDESWEISNNMIEPTYDWATGMDINVLFKKHNMFEGTFTKDMLKLSNIIQEVSTVATYLEKGTLMEKTNKLENLIIKNIIKIESLYVK